MQRCTMLFYIKTKGSMGSQSHSFVGTEGHLYFIGLSQCFRTFILVIKILK